MPAKPKKVVLEETLRWAFQSTLTMANSCTIGNNRLMAAHSSHAMFMDFAVSDTFVTFQRMMDQHGDGVSCCAGHKVYDVYAYAEGSTRANIFIYSLAEQRLIGTLINAEHEYRRILSICFSETDHLVVLTGNPDYILEVWNWRTEKLLVSQKTEQISDMQYIRCSSSFPLTAAQVSINTGKILFWEINIAVDMAVLIKRSVKIINVSAAVNGDGPYHICYALDGSLYVTNIRGPVWNVFPSAEKVIEIIPFRYDERSVSRIMETTNSHPAVHVSLISLYKGGIIKTGPDGLLRFYKKSNADWEEIWSVFISVPFLVMHCLGHGDRIVAWDTFGSVQEHCESPENDHSFRVIRHFDRFVRSFVLLSPVGDQVVTLNDFDEIIVSEVSTGERLAMVIHEHIECMTNHPTVPVVALGGSNGIVSLMSFFHLNQPTVMTTFHLSSYPFNDVHYTPNGCTLLAVDSMNNLFIIEGTMGSNMIVKNHICLQVRLFSIIVRKKGMDLNVTALAVPVIATEKQKSESYFELEIDGGGSFFERHATLPKEYIFLYELQKDNPHQYIAVPFSSHSFEIIELVYERAGGDPVVNILQNVPTQHQFCYIQMAVYANFFISWGLGGHVLVWDKQTLQILVTHKAFTYYLGGVRRALCDPFRQNIITLGNSETLQCVSLDRNSFDRNQYISMKQQLLTKDVRQMFLNKTIGFVPEGNDEGKTWLQLKAEHEEKIGREKFEAARKSIEFDLSILKEKLKVLIDANEQAPDDEKLPIEDFNLDKEGAKQHDELARINREQVEKRINAESDALNRITNIIKESTWDLMQVKGKQVRGIFTRLRVENYALNFPNKKRDYDLQRITMWRAAERCVAHDDIFEPWKPMEFGEMEMMLSSRPTYTDFETRSRNSSSTTIGEKTEAQKLKLKNKFAFSGTPSHKYIAPLDLRYQQMEVVTYQQLMAEIIMGYHDTLALRKYFNKVFDEMVLVKENEMNLSLQRNSRLRHIQDELNCLEDLKSSGVRYDRDIIDPEYVPDEIPDSIVTVEPNELSVTPYVSPSVQHLRDLIAAEEERRRLELLADDFRERALIRMMDGVLEIRWEDEIKKSPPIPLCLTNGKDPKDFTPEDLLAIHLYEEELKFLHSERERYHQMLTDEQTKIDNMMYDQLMKFNLRVGETLMEKLRVEFAIICEDLKLLRVQQYQFKRTQFLEDETKAASEEMEIRKEIEHLTGVLSTFEDVFLGCKTKYDELSAKDRALDKQFKISFSEFGGQAAVDQASRLFKRRPKWQMRAWQTAAILQDMANRVNGADLSRTGPPLPIECFDYLSNLDQIDKFSNAPNLLDTNLWSIFCKMRRVKIEVEFKVRSLGVTMAEAEASVNAYVREINMAKARIAKIEKYIFELRLQKNQSTTNRTVQLSMSRGQVEISLSGRVGDFSNSILLHESDVHAINDVIKKAGQKKLKTMEHAAVFRRKIIFKEWEHKMMRLKIEEKIEQIRLIEKTKITKEVQMWLKYKELGWKDDISQTALDREIEASRMSLQGMCNDIIKKINDTEYQCETKRQSNMRLDKRIQNLNLDITALNLTRDFYTEERDARRKRERMQMLVQRSRLIRQVQKQHGKILELSTLLELQRLRTFPTLNMHSINCPS